MEYVFLIIITIFVCIYLTDRKGWNATAKRLSGIVRANIESAKPIKQIEKKIEQHEIDSWTAEFEGKPADTELGHVIIKTWLGTFGGSDSAHFKCKCGHTDWHVSINEAQRISNKHVEDHNNADALLKKNGGTHAW
jgi:hypothetical protein